jgi:hypothetical protein
MAKNKKVIQEEFEEVFDFSDMDDMYDDGAMSEVMQILMESSNHQMKMAVELTKLIVENNLAKNADADAVFSLFKKASKVISETHNLNVLMEELGSK